MRYVKHMFTTGAIVLILYFGSIVVGTALSYDSPRDAKDAPSDTIPSNLSIDTVSASYAPFTYFQIPDTAYITQTKDGVKNTWLIPHGSIIGIQSYLLPIDMREPKAF